MYKETIICTIVFIIILGLNYITDNNTSNTIKDMYENLNIVRSDILAENPNKEVAMGHAEDAYNKWEDKDDIMAYYIEHNELEKVKTALTSMKSFVETEEYVQAVEAIDRCMYILDHIYEREKLSLDNIF